jgi:hypothetical protein
VNQVLENGFGVQLDVNWAIFFVNYPKKLGVF